MNETPRTRLVAYSVAVLGPVVSLLIRWPLWSVLEDRLPHMTFLPAVALAAYYGGLRPGLLATLLGALAADYFLLTSHTSPQVSYIHVAVGFCLFVLTGAIISALSELLHRARRRVVDITDHMRSEQALRESEQRWRILTEALPQFVWTASADGTSDYFSAQIVEYTGLAENALLAWGWMDVLHPDDREHTRNSWIDAIAKERNHEVEHRIRSSDGAFRWFTTRGVPIRDTAGHIVKWFGTCTDITEHKRSEQALRESEQRWRSLTEALPQLVWTATPDGACDYFSTQWTQFTGIPESHLLGWQWMETLHPDDREATRHLWTESVAGRSDYDVEYRVRRLDGEYRWFKTRGLPIRDNERRIFKWFGTCTDITEVKMAAEELRLAKETAESANRAKDEFLANVSHEIRTPMNAILGMTELALDTPLTDFQRQSLKTVKAAADNLLGIINDLLDFSKIEAGKLELDPGDFSLRIVLRDTLRVLAMRAHKKGLELVSDVETNVPDTLVGDAGRLRQVLLNLVGNAIKFTDEGEVVVTIRRQESGVRSQGLDDTSPADSCLLQFAVHDTGIGIPHDKQEKIFRAFEQEDTSTTRKYGGTGLGLSIAARLVALMGGTITVDSAPGRGSTFTFTAQLGRQPHSVDSAAPQPPVLLDSLPVLIVDDNSTNRHILEEWLRNWRMAPVAVGDGVAAMDTLWDAATLGNPYTLVLLDARMPDTDGLVLAAKIRKRAELSATRIILLTSGSMPHDLAELRELRINAHLLKPLQQDELLETIYRVMSRTNGNAPAVPEAAPAQHPPLTPDQSMAPLRILVAEDNDFNSQLLEQLLVRRGHRVELVNDGRKAMSLAEKVAFDLLLLDIHMPQLDGFQVIQTIRERERSTGEHLPVIALTARSRKEDRERCLAAGMDGFLAKPIHAATLWDAIDRIVITNTQASTATESSVAGVESQLLDACVLLAACGSDGAILSNLCKTFHARLPDHLKAIQDAMRDRDAPRLREAAHKLCGMIGAFSSVAGAMASNLEDFAAEGRLDETKPLIEQLETMSHELIRRVSNLSVETLQYQVSVNDERNRRADS
jgi:two-component system sensor histidine kinase/response regulator